jgi:putative oxidoreductase
MLLTAATPRQLSVGIAIVRVVTGIIMFAHGYQKVFTNGIDGVTGFFTQLGIPLPGLAAPLVAFLELAGGVALVLGLLTRLVALGFVFDMLGAIFFVHLENGFFLPGGIEFVLLLAAASLAFVIAGAGAFSLDEAIARRRFTRSDDVVVRSTS